MSSSGLLDRVHALGIEVSRQGDRLHVEAPTGVVNAELLADLREHKSTLLEVLWRVEAMRRQLATVSYIPLLVAREAPVLPGLCVSCGDTVPEGNPGRCGLCVAAAVWALRERRSTSG